MPRVDRAHIQAFEVRDTGVCGYGIIHEGVEGWPSCVLKEITAEQFPACGQDAYGLPGMPRQGDYFGLEAVLREVVSVVEEDIGGESLGGSKSREDREEASDEYVRLLSVHEHVSAFGHA